MKVQVVKNTSNELPAYADKGCSGMDLRADLRLINPKFLFDCEIIQKPSSDYINRIVINPGGRALIPTGLHVAIPNGYELQVRARSGLALKHGISVTNGIGTIDSSYRGDVGVILTNTGSEPFEIEQGDRIAQAVVAKVEHVEWEQVKSLDETERGEGGFGHTNIK